MGILESMIMGAIQGITEFLPISSSGHLVLFQNLFGLNTENILFDICLHIATLGAVLFVFWKKVVQLVKHPFSSMAVKLYVATIPTVVLVLIFREYIETSFGGYFFVFGFIITAMMLLVTELFSRKKEKQPLGKLSSFFMGVAQGIATLPGVSRSGSTICMGLMLGKDRKEVAEFSFLMSIPVIIASLVYELCFSEQIVAVELIPLILGMFTAFVLGVLAIKFMLKIIQKTSLIWFALYLSILVCIITFLYF